MVCFFFFSQRLLSLKTDFNCFNSVCHTDTHTPPQLVQLVSTNGLKGSKVPTLADGLSSSTRLFEHISTGQPCTMSLCYTSNVQSNTFRVAPSSCHPTSSLFLILPLECDLCWPWLALLEDFFTLGGVSMGLWGLFTRWRSFAGWWRVCLTQRSHQNMQVVKTV